MRKKYRFIKFRLEKKHECTYICSVILNEEIIRVCDKWGNCILSTFSFIVLHVTE